MHVECFKAYTYSNGFIYIGESKCLNTIEHKEGNVLVLDARNLKNPCMKIFDSYKITNEKVQKEIIDELLHHEEVHPTKWERTKKSMVNEWYAHNTLYNLNIKRTRTRDVDLDNSDEDVYKEKLGVNTLIKYFSK